MHPRDFLKGFAEDVDRERLVEVVHEEMFTYCQQNNITIDEVSNDELWELADGFVTRGLSYEGLGDEGRWRASGNVETDISDEIPPEQAIELLKEHYEPDKEYEYRLNWDNDGDDNE